MQDESKYLLDAQEYLKESIDLSINLLNFQGHVGRVEPDVRT